MKMPKGKYGPLMIAEIGGNHEGNFDYAKELINLAIESDSDAIKLQVYTGDTLVSEVENPVRNKHFKKFEFSVDQYIELIKIIKDAGKLFTASIWDTNLIDALDDHIDFYKIGSGDFTAFPIIKHIASKEKPIILSSGLSTAEDVDQVVEFLCQLNPIYKDPAMLGLLQCTSMYPIEDSDANLSVMDIYKEKYNVSVGYSDHTVGSKALFLACVKGADILEYHFTDIKEGRSFRDHLVSLTKEDVNALIEDIKMFTVFNGEHHKKPLAIEIENNHVETFRRSVYPARDIEAGQVLKEEDLVVLRPNVGIDAREFYTLIGKTTKVALSKHKAFSKEDLI